MLSPVLSVACAMRTNGGGWEIARTARYAKCTNVLWSDLVGAALGPRSVLSIKKKQPGRERSAETWHTRVSLMSQPWRTLSCR